MNRSIKKVSTLMLAASITSSLLFSGEAKASTNYMDVPTNHWAHSTIKEATELGYFKGDGNGNFNPDNDVTRAEFAQILARMFDGQERVTEPFVDVDNAFWGKDAIEELLALGIINANDYSKKRFEPTKAMTRNELSKWLTNALSVKQPEYATIMTTIRDSSHTLLPTTEFLNGGIAKADQGYIGVVLGTGLFTGYLDGSFKPKGNTSRSEVATLAIRFKNMQDKSPTEFNGLNELVEVSKTGTNMNSATKFRNYDDMSFDKVVNQPLPLSNGVGTITFHRLIFVETSATKQDSINNSIYGKMFLGTDKWFIADHVYIFVEQTLLPNKQPDYFTLTGGYDSNLVTTEDITKEDLSKYNIVSIKAQTMDKFFKVGQSKRYWSNPVLSKTMTSHITLKSGNRFKTYSTY